MAPTAMIEELSSTSPSPKTLRLTGVVDANRIEYLIQDAPGSTPSSETEPTGMAAIERGEAFTVDVTGLSQGQRRVFVRGVDTEAVIYTISTQEGTDPEATHTQLSTRDAVRVWTGETPVSEPYFYLYARRGETTSKIRMNRFESRLLRIAPGESFGFATEDGRSIQFAYDNSPVSLTASLVVEGTANCDKAGPPLWEPTAPHITLGDGKSFQIESDGTNRILFVSEFDGETWSPPRWLRLPESGGVRYHATFKQIAIANYDGYPVDISAPANSVIGGESVAMHLSMPEVTGTTHNVSDVAGLKAAIATAVAGDEIVLADGTYELDVNISTSSFAANNGIGGNAGMSGITIRSASGDRDACIITGSEGDTNNWFLTHEVNSPLAGLKGITWDFAGTTAGSWTSRLGRWAFENCRFTNSPVDAFNFIGEVGVETPRQGLYLDMLRCQGDTCGGDCFNGSNGADGTYRCRFIDCIGHTSGDSVGAQCLTSHFGLNVETYGGHYYNAHTNAVSFQGSTHDCFMFFTKVSRGSRNGNVLGVYAYACELLVYNFSINISGGGGSTGPANPGWMIGSVAIGGIREAYDGADRIIEGNHLSSDAYFPTANSAISFAHNVCVSAQCNFSSNSSENPVAARYNSWINCTTALNAVSITRQKTFIGNACKGSGTSVNTNATAMGLLTSDYNVLDPSINAAYVPGANDITGVDAELDDRYFPTDSGNCEGNGDPDATDWIGGTDYEGYPLRLASSVMDRGARCRPRIIEGAELLPDLW